MKLVTADLLDIHHHPFGSTDPNGEKIARRLFLPPLLEESAQKKIWSHLANYFKIHRVMPDELVKKEITNYSLKFYFNPPYHNHGRGKLGHFGEQKNSTLPVENLADCYFMDNGDTVELHIFDNITFT
ncbi:hypothetical protein GCM10027284_30610 [Cyclobacterium sediminis]